MIQKAGVLDTQARLHYELFRAMLEELMSGKAAGGGAGGGCGLSRPGGKLAYPGLSTSG